MLSKDLILRVIITGLLFHVLLGPMANGIADAIIKRIDG